MRRLAIPVVVGLAVGIALGLVVARSGAATGDGELTDLRLWLLGVAVLSLFATGPVTGALTGLAAMVGVLGTLELTPFVIDGVPQEFRDLFADLLDDTTWLDPPMLAAAALAGAAVGTARLVVRTGKRLVLVVVAVAVLAVVVLGAPRLSDLPFAPTEDIAVIR